MRTAEETRTCRACGDEKPIEDFQVYDYTDGKRRHRCRTCESARVKRHRHKLMGQDLVGFRAKRTAITRKNRYGITQEQYDEMLEAQGGGCAICGSPLPRNSGKSHLAVDHDHKTGRVRGLLCDPCNNGLARFDDDPEKLMKAAKYLSGVMAFIAAQFALLGAMFLIRTNAGRDHQSKVMADNASNGTGAYASGCYIGLTANDDSPAAGNTSLAGEITTGTLARAQAIFAHTTGTNLYTLTKTFTSDQTVVISKIGIFTAASGGVLCFEALLDTPVTLRSGDQIQITHAVTI